MLYGPRAIAKEHGHIPFFTQHIRDDHAYIRVIINNHNFWMRFWMPASHRPIPRLPHA